MRKNKLLLSCFLLLCSISIGQEDKRVAEDDLSWNETKFSRMLGVNEEPIPMKENQTSVTNRGFVLQALGPNYYSSAGFFIEQTLNETMAIQYDLRIQIQTIDSDAFSIGPALKQSLVFGEDRFRISVGLSQGIVFNASRWNGGYVDYNNEFYTIEPWKEAPKSVFLFGLHVGPEFELGRDFFYITPELILNQINERKYTKSKPDQLSTVSSFSLTIGLGLKFRLRNK